MLDKIIELLEENLKRLEAENKELKQQYAALTTKPNQSKNTRSNPEMSKAFLRIVV